MDGGIYAGTRFLGSGFVLADRIVATANHVVKEYGAADLSFVTSGVRVAVKDVQRGPRIDTALLRVNTSLAMLPSLARPRQGSQWCVNCSLGELEPAAVQLSGVIDAVGLLIENARGHQVRVLQLQVHQEIKNYEGYSGGAVMVDGSVVGILIEQVPERVRRALGQDKVATNVLFAVSIEEVNRRFKLDLELMRERDQPPPYQLLDTAYFDLEPLKDVILDVKETAEDRMLAFGLDSADLQVDREAADNLAGWLQLHMMPVVHRRPLTLRPDFGSVDKMVGYFELHIDHLNRTNVVCTVEVEGVPISFVDEVWRRVRLACESRRGSLSHRLVLFFAGSTTDGYPPAVTRLPPVTFTRDHLTAWAKQVVRHQQWPDRLAHAWVDRLAEQSSSDGRLDVRWTYDALRDSIDRLRTDREGLYDDLEDLELSW